MFMSGDLPGPHCQLGVEIVPGASQFDHRHDILAGNLVTLVKDLYAGRRQTNCRAASTAAGP